MGPVNRFVDIVSWDFERRTCFKKLSVEEIIAIPTTEKWPIVQECKVMSQAVEVVENLLENDVPKLFYEEIIKKD